jgi:hypothetical protein
MQGSLLTFSPHLGMRLLTIATLFYYLSFLINDESYLILWSTILIINFSVPFYYHSFIFTSGLKFAVSSEFGEVFDMMTVQFYMIFRKSASKLARIRGILIRHEF